MLKSKGIRMARPHLSRPTGLSRWRIGKFIFIFAIFAASIVAAAGTADPNRYLEDIKALSAPSTEGRGAGTKGIVRAADLIEQRYRSLGLQPAGTKSYLQPFTVITGSKLKGTNRLEVENGSSKKDLKLNQEYVPFSFSASGEISGPVVFAGFGATATEFGYDDYAHLDVKDKIVVILRYEPLGFAAKDAHAGLTEHSQLITKAINARNHGAKAVILVNGKLGDGEEDVLTRFGSISGPQDVGVLLVQVKNSIADGWFKGAGKSLTDAQMQIAHSGKPNSFALPPDLQASVKVDIEA